MRASRVKSSSPGSLNFSYDSVDGRRRIGIELEFLVLGGQDCQPIPDRVSEAGAIFDRLAFLGVFPGGLFLGRVVGLRRPGSCRLRIRC